MTRITKTEPQKLDDELLENVVGGVGALDVAAGLVCPTLLVSFGCSVANCVYHRKADKAKSEGEITDYEKYILKAKNCGIAATSSLGVFISLMIMFGAVGNLQDRNNNA